MKDDTVLARWLAGELNDTELRELEADPRYATLLRIRGNFEQVERPAFDGGPMLQTILGAEKAAPPKVVPLYRRYRLQAGAAAIVVLLGLGFFLYQPETMVAANGETFAFVLPDQSEVRLNSGSQAVYRDFNWDANREVELEGEAYFKVAKGKAFTVATPLGSVTVLGTQFNVKARGNRFDVSCYEGRVLVKYNGQETVLTAGQSVTVQDSQTAGITPEEAAAPQWTEGELAFSNEQLPGVIAEIERRYDVTIEADFDSAQPFSGAMPGNDLDATLKALSLAYHLKVSKNGNTIILKPVNAAE